MSRRARLGLFAASGAGMAALLAWAYSGLPAFGSFAGRYGQALARMTVPERGATSSVAVTTFDFRGLDTLGEEFILFAAAVGVMVLLRAQRRGEQVAAEPAGAHRPTARSRALRSVATALAAPVLVLGASVVAHGHLTPGGGFQGGVILMSAFVLVYAGGAHLRAERVRPLSAMELAEGLGAGGFALIGIGGLALAGSFLENFLGPGQKGSLLSGGDVPLLNAAVGLEVMGALLVVLGELLDQRFLVRRGRR